MCNHILSMYKVQVRSIIDIYIYLIICMLYVQDVSHIPIIYVNYMPKYSPCYKDHFMAGQMCSEICQRGGPSHLCAVSHRCSSAVPFY